jgi:maltose O-acetyltransferase
VTGRASLSTGLREEWNGARPLLQIALALTRVLPDLVGNRSRATLLRLVGVKIGRGTVIGGGIRVVGIGRCQDRLSIGERCWVNAGCYFDVSDRVDIGDDVAIGQQVLLLTQSHQVGRPTRRAGSLITGPIRIANGCWLGARSVVLPGVSIGRGAIVAAGAVVTADVAPDTMVGGVPARAIRSLEGRESVGRP